VQLIDDIAKTDAETAKFLRDEIAPRLFVQKAGQQPKESKKRKRSEEPQVATTSTSRAHSTVECLISTSNCSIGRRDSADQINSNPADDAKLLEQIQEKEADLKKLIQQVAAAREEAPIEIRDNLERAAKRRKLAVSSEPTPVVTTTTTTTSSTTNTPRKGASTPGRTPKKTPLKLKQASASELETVPPPVALLKEAATNIPVAINNIKKQKRRLDELQGSVTNMLEASKVKLRKIEDAYVT